MSGWFELRAGMESQGRAVFFAISIHPSIYLSIDIYSFSVTFFFVLVVLFVYL